jgi:hypothetical protein
MCALRHGRVADDTASRLSRGILQLLGELGPFPGKLCIALSSAGIRGVFRQLAKLGDMVTPLCQCQRMPPTTMIGESVALSDRFRLSVFLDIKAMKRAPDAGCEKRARWGYLLPCRDAVGEARGGSRRASNFTRQAAQATAKGRPKRCSTQQKP